MTGARLLILSLLLCLSTSCGASGRTHVVTDGKDRSPESRLWWKKVRKRGYTYINKIRYWSSPVSTRVVIDLPGEVRYRYFLLKSPPRLCIDLKRTVIHPPKQSIDIGSSTVKRVRASQFTEDTARVVLDLGEIKSYRVFPLKDPKGLSGIPFRIVIDISSRGGKGAAPCKPSVRSAPSIARQLGLKPRVIVLDPGHGGRDV